MSRITENWERVVRSVPCPICGAVKGAPCTSFYGGKFKPEGKGHQGRRGKYYILKARRREKRLAKGGL